MATILLRKLVESRLCALVADQQGCEVAWRGAVFTRLPDAAAALSDIALLDQYERFLSLKVLREPHN